MRISLQARLVMLVVTAILPLFALSLYTALRDTQNAVDLAKSNLQLTAALAAASQGLPGSVSGMPLPPGARLSIMDANGTVLAAQAGEAGIIGQEVPSQVLRDAVRGGKSGVFEGIDEQGRERIYAVAHGAGRATFIGVSMDLDQVVGASRSRLALELLALALVTLLGGYAAWVMGGRAIVAPTRQILDASSRLKKGQLDARIALEPLKSAGEFERIAAGFNLMAESLQLRQREIESELGHSRQAYATLETVTNSMREGLIAVDGNGQLLMFNEAATRILALNEAPVPPRDWPQRYGLYMVGSDTICDWRELPLYRALQGESSNQLDFIVRNPQAPEGRLVRCSYRPMYNGEAIVGALVVFADISEVQRDIDRREHAQAALAQSEQRYATLFEQGPLPMWVFDSATARFIAVNDAAIRQYGYSRDEFLGMTLADIRPESERLRLQARLGGGFSGEPETWLHRRKDGTEFSAEVVSRPISHGGQAARFVVAHDISARVKAEKDVQEYLFTLQRSADASTAVVLHQTLQGTLQEVVDQARAVIRAHQGIVSLTVGKNWAQSVSAVSLSEKYAAYRDYMEDPDGSGIYAMVCETNRPMRMTQQELEAHPRWRGFGAAAAKHPAMRGWLAVPLVSRSGENIGVLQLTDKYEGEFTLQDEYVAVEMAQLASIAIENARLFEQITELNAGLEKKVAERTAELSRQEALFRALAEQAPQVVWNYEQGRGVTYFNRVWYELMGGGPDDWLGTKWMSAVHPEDRAGMRENWLRSEAAGTVFSGIRRLRAWDGTYHTMSYKSVPVRGDDGTIAFWVGIDADITEIKAIEQALRQSNKELESFSYSVSHDLRSPLSAIDGFSRLLARQLGASADEKTVHYLGRIQHGVAQMGELIEDLLSLAQVSRASVSHASVDLSAMAREILARHQGRDGERSVLVQVEDNLVTQGDARLIRIVMENLLGNAWKFTSRQERAEITVGRLPDGTAFFVRDNGAGFDMAYADKLFGVFQRLHSGTDFPGTGIGLATVNRIISRHQGRVWAEASPGQGATFFFSLPDVPTPPLGGGVADGEEEKGAEA